MPLRPNRSDRGNGRTGPLFRAAIQGRLTSGSRGTPPILSSVSSGTPNATDATITWTTNVPSDSSVFWGLTTAYAGASSPVQNHAFQTSHSVQITGLTTATTYHYKVRSWDPVTGGYQDSADATFVTA